MPKNSFLYPSSAPLSVAAAPRRFLLSHGTFVNLRRCTRCDTSSTRIDSTAAYHFARRPSSDKDIVRRLEPGGRYRDFDSARLAPHCRGTPLLLCDKSAS